MTIRKIRTVSVWADSPMSADNYVHSMIEDYDVNISIAPSIEDAIRPADLIIAANSSQQSLIKADWLKPGVHISAVGYNGPGQQQLHLDMLARVDVIVVDSFSQCANYGEIHYGFEAGVITKANIQGELGDLIIGRIPGRTDANQITLADLTGLEVQDTVVATLALQKALFLGVGQRIAEPALVKQA